MPSSSKTSASNALEFISAGHPSQFKDRTTMKKVRSLVMSDYVSQIESRYREQGGDGVVPKVEPHQDDLSQVSKFKKPTEPYSSLTFTEEKAAHDAKSLPSESITEGKALQPTSITTCRECGKSFRRPCDLTKHGKTHSRPWKCSHVDCKYFELGWPTEKELNRHINDKHSATPKLFSCLFSPCSYFSKRESNCKQHMEKAHGWNYVRSKTNGSKSRQSRSGIPLATPRSETPSSSRSRTPLTPLHPREYPNILLTPTSEPFNSEMSISAVPPSATSPSFHSNYSAYDMSVSNDWAFGVSDTSLDEQLGKDTNSEDHDYVRLPNQESHAPEHVLDWSEAKNGERCSLASSLDAEESASVFNAADRSPVSEAENSTLWKDTYQPSPTPLNDSMPPPLLAPEDLRNKKPTSKPFPNGNANMQISTNLSEENMSKGQPNEMTDSPEDTGRQPRLSRKRSKVGCLTCRKRRIKCDEERPKCANCAISKRHCEGYNARAIFQVPAVLPTPPPIPSWMAGTYTPSALDLSHRYPLAEGWKSSVYGPKLQNVSIVDSTYGSASVSAASMTGPTSVNLYLRKDDHWPQIDSRKRQKLEGPAKMASEPHVVLPDGKKALVLRSKFTHQKQLSSQKLKPTSGGSTVIELVRRTKINSALQKIESLLSVPEIPDEDKAVKDLGHSDSGYESSQASSRAATMDKAADHITTIEQDVNRAMTTPNFDPGSGDSISMDVVASSEREFPSDTEASGLSDETDVSADIDWTGHILDVFRAPAVARLLERFFQKLGDSIRTHANGRGTSNHAPSSSNGSRDSGNFSSEQSKLPQKRKADDYEREGGDEEERNAGSSTKTNSQEPEKLLACPFYKFNSTKYRGCNKYTLRDISRVKQHLRRCHGIPKYCPVCYGIFSSDKTRDEHIRSRNCQSQPAVNFECVSEEQRKLLEQRVSKTRGTVENWYTIYEIVFPGAPRPDSPFVEVVLSEQLCELQDFTASEGPQIINELVHTRIPPHLRPQESEVTAFTQVLFQDAVTTLLERLETTRTSAPSHDRSFTSATQSEASPGLSRMPMPSPNHQGRGAQPPHDAPRENGIHHADSPPYQVRHNPGPSANYQGFDPSPPAPAHVNPGEYLATAAPRMVPNLSNGSWQPPTPDSGYRSGSSGNAVGAGPSRVPPPTSSPFMGFDGSCDNLPGPEDFVDESMLWWPTFD